MKWSRVGFGFFCFFSATVSSLVSPRCFVRQWKLWAGTQNAGGDTFRWRCFFVSVSKHPSAHIHCNQFHWFAIWVCLLFLITPKQVTCLILHFSSEAFLISFQSGREKGYRAVSMVIAGRRNGRGQWKLIFHLCCHAILLCPPCLWLNIQELPQRQRLNVKKREPLVLCARRLCVCVDVCACVCVPICFYCTCMYVLAAEHSLHTAPALCSIFTVVQP